MDLLERYKTDFRLSQNHTDNVWQKLILSFSVKAVRYLGFNYSNILYNDPDQRCSVIQLPQLHLLLYSRWDYSFLTLLEEKKTSKKVVWCLVVQSQENKDQIQALWSWQTVNCKHQFPPAAATEHTHHGEGQVGFLAWHRLTACF